MFELRSRSVALGVATGVCVLALPVVAWGQVPVVDQVVGGVNNAAQQVVQAAPAPPAPLPAAPVAPAPKPAAPAPAPAPSASPAAPSPSSAAPAAAPARAATVSQSSTRSRGSARSGHATRASASGKSSEGRHSHKRARAADKADPIPAHAAGSPTDTDIADDAAGVPPDASPAKLPFTGLQLALMAMAGIAALASGSVLRRTAR